MSSGPRSVPQRRPVDAGTQPVGQHVVGELGHCPLPGPTTHLQATVIVVQKVGQGTGHALDRPRRTDHQTGSTMLHRLGCSTALAGDLCDAGGGGRPPRPAAGGAGGGRAAA